MFEEEGLISTRKLRSEIKKLVIIKQYSNYDPT